VFFFWKTGFYPENQSYLEDFKQALIGWKSRPSKKATSFLDI